MITETSPEQLVREASARVRAPWSAPITSLSSRRSGRRRVQGRPRAGLLTGYVSNGHATPRVLGYLAPWIDLFKVDLKGFDALQYRNYGGRLEPVLETIRGSTREASGSKS